MTRTRGWTAALLLAAALGGCGGSRDEIITSETEQTLRQAELRIKESRTLSGLAKLEESLYNYHRTEHRIPERLDRLIPKYLAEIPVVEIGVRGHRDTDRVQSYPSDILRDGQLDGTRLRDTGRWGYVFNDRQVVVFVDCTHKSSRGRAWYLERGVF